MEAVCTSSNNGKLPLEYTTAHPWRQSQPTHGTPCSSTALHLQFMGYLAVKPVSSCLRTDGKWKWELLWKRREVQQLISLTICSHILDILKRLPNQYNIKWSHCNIKWSDLHCRSDFISVSLHPGSEKAIAIIRILQMSLYVLYIQTHINEYPSELIYWGEGASDHLFSFTICKNHTTVPVNYLTFTNQLPFITTVDNIGFRSTLALKSSA